MMRVNPGRNIFSINVELSNTLFTLLRFIPPSTSNFKCGECTNCFFYIPFKFSIPSIPTNQFLL